MRTIVSVPLALAAFLSTGGNSYAILEARWPLFTDVDLSSPGVETIIPFQRLIDTNGDGIQDRYQVLLKVYAGGTKTLLYQTAARNFPITYSCAAPFTVGGFGSDISPLREPSSSRIHLALTVRATCTEVGVWGFQPFQASFVYSADAADASGPVWTYATSTPLAFDAVDVDGDGSQEVVLTGLVFLSPDGTAGGYNTVVTVLDEDTGAVISRTSYPELRY